MTMDDVAAAIALAGHRGDTELARRHLTDDNARYRRLAVSALHRIGDLSTDELTAALGDPAAQVRQRAAELAATSPLALTTLLDDPEPMVVEMAAWALGEREHPAPHDVAALERISADHPEALVREAALAALGAIGAPSSLVAILRGTTDKPAVRRRAVLALVSYDGPEVDEALNRALDDRDWQVRQAAEDLMS